MPDAHRLLVRTVCVSAAALAVAGAVQLPADTLTLILVALTAWTCASVPIGVLVGHSALGEK